MLQAKDGYVFGIDIKEQRLDINQQDGYEGYAKPNLELFVFLGRNDEIVHGILKCCG